MLVALLHLFTGHGWAFLFDGESDALDHQGRREHPKVVIHAANIFRYFLVLRLIHRENVLKHWKVPAHASQVDAQIALRRVPPRDLHVFLACPRKQADHPMEWEAVLLEFSNRHGWGVAKEMPHDPIGPHATRDVEHLGRHLYPGRWHRKVPALITLQRADAI